MASTRQLTPANPKAIAAVLDAIHRGADLVVVQGNCLTVLPYLPPNRIHLTVTDPPYESLERHRRIGTTTRLKESKSSSNPWFQIFKNTDYFELLAEIHRVQNPDSHCYVFCDTETEHIILSGRNPFDSDLDETMISFMAGTNDSPSPPAKWAGWRAWPTLNWVKTTQAEGQREPEDLVDSSIRSGMGYHWRRCGERILFLEKGKRRLNELGWKDHLLGPRPGKGDAPAKKPDAVIERLILNSTKEGETVLDPFAGSGSVGRMALKHGRRAILIDVTLDWLKHRRWPEIRGKKTKVVQWTSQ